MVVQVVPANPREVCRLVEQDCDVPLTIQLGREIRHASRITSYISNDTVYNELERRGASKPEGCVTGERAGTGAPLHDSSGQGDWRPRQANLLVAIALEHTLGARWP